MELSARPLSQGSSSVTGNSQSSHQQTTTKPGPPIPQKDNRRRSHSPQPVSAIDTQLPPGGFFSAHDQRSGSPGRPNFSYPARTPPIPQGQAPQYNSNTTQPLRLSNSNGAQQPQYQAYNPAAGHAGPYDRSHPLSGQLAAQDKSGYGYGPNTHGVSPVSTIDRQHAGAHLDRPGTVQSIKSAAAGIHVSYYPAYPFPSRRRTIRNKLTNPAPQGASETLRGAVNSTIARHTGAPPEVIAAHEAVTAKGRAEIESGRFYKPVPNSNLAPLRNSTVPPTVSPEHQGDAGYSRTPQAPSSNPRWSAGNSANGVLSQVPGESQGGVNGAPYYGGSAAVGTDREDEAGKKKKGGFRNVLRKSREPLKT